MFTKQGDLKMLYDKENMFSDNQVITADAASTNVLELAKGPIKEVAFGTPIPLRIQVTKTFTGITSASTLEIKVQTDDNEAFSSPTVLATSGAIPMTDLIKGFVAPINYLPKGNQGFMRLYYDVTLNASETVTAGNITAGIVASNGGSYHEM